MATAENSNSSILERYYYYLDQGGIREYLKLQSMGWIKIYKVLNYLFLKIRG